MGLHCFDGIFWGLKAVKAAVRAVTHVDPQALAAELHSVYVEHGLLRLLAVLEFDETEVALGNETAEMGARTGRRSAKRSCSSNKFGIG